MPVITYETAYRDDEEIHLATEYDSRVRDVPVEVVKHGAHSNDSGDGYDSDEYGRGRDLNADIPVTVRKGGRDHYWAQDGYGYYTNDSSEDEHYYTLTDYVTEEYHVPKKVAVVDSKSVPYQVATTEYVTEEYAVETLEAYQVEKQIPYTVER